MLVRHAIAAALLAAATPSGAAIIYQTSAAFSGGQAFLSDYLTVPHVLATGTTWVGVSLGAIDYGQWTIDGEEQRLWWEPIPDEDGNDVPHLTGNEYFYSPACSSTLADPVCSGGDLDTLLSGNLFRADFTLPAGFNFCQPFNGIYYQDCAASYSVIAAIVDLSVTASAPDGTSVTFTFYDADPSAVVPEPATWALMITGFGLSGGALRRQRSALA